MGYLYRFIGKDGEVLYIGKTTVTMAARMGVHFSEGDYRNNSMTDRALYKEYVKIEYAEVGNETDLSFLEVYLIMLHKPKYNLQYASGEPLTYRINVSLEWKEYDFNPSENRHHQIRVYMDGLEYEIPCEKKIYDALAKELGLSARFEDIRMQDKRRDGKYLVSLVSLGGYYRRGWKVERPRCVFMGYPNERYIEEICQHEIV